MPQPPYSGPYPDALLNTCSGFRLVLKGRGLDFMACELDADPETLLRRRMNNKDSILIGVNNEFAFC
jgi:hypothetical protein